MAETNPAELAKRAREEQNAKNLGLKTAKATAKAEKKQPEGE